MKTIKHLDMSAVMAAYTAKVKAEAAQAEAVRAAVAAGSPLPAPTTVWCVSDRH